MARCPVFILNSTSKSPDGVSLTKPEDGSIHGSYLYWNGVKWANEARTVHLGANAGGPFQGANGIALGPSAGISQGVSAIAIGVSAGNSYQGASAIAIGYQTGFNSQGLNAIAIGSNAGQNMQSNSAIAIGSNSGQISQSVNAIAVGSNAGNNTQGSNSIAVGSNAGLNYQGINCIAIGSNAGRYNQGSNSIAIGNNAGATSQASNSIILNASSIALDATGSGFFVSSIQGPRSSSNVLSYDTTTCEVYYNGSSERYKYDIKNLSTDTSVVYNLQPRSFKYTLSDEPDVGLIAEEAYKCDPSFAYLDKDQLPEGIQWNVITTYLIAEFKKLKTELDELESSLICVPNQIN
jgi:hypothetical protein